LFSLSRLLRRTEEEEEEKEPRAREGEQEERQEPEWLAAELGEKFGGPETE